MDQPPEHPTKGNKQVVLDLFRESIGWETGIVRTIRALRKEPQVVLTDYLEHRRVYVSPFKFLITSLSLWILINSFIIDWYAIWGEFLSDYVDFLFSLKDSSKVDPVKVEELKAKYFIHISNFAGDLFTKFYVPLVIVVIPISALIVRRSCAKYGVDFRSLVAANAYMMGANVISYLLMTILAAINLLALAAFSIVAFAFLFSGRNIFMLLPPRRFFGEHGKSIEKQIVKGNVLGTMCIFLPFMIGYLVWFFMNVKR